VIQQILFYFLLLTLLIACEQRNPDNAVEDTLSVNPNHSEIKVENRILTTSNTALTIIAPPNIQQSSSSDKMTTVTLGQPTIIHSTGDVTISNNAPENGFFIGETIVTWTAQDTSGKQVTAQQIVRIDTVCPTEMPFFQQHIWPILQKKCVVCHREGKVVSHLNFKDSLTFNYLAINFEVMQKNATLQDNNQQSIFLNKATNIFNDHGGGSIVTETSPAYLSLSEMIQRFVNCNQNDMITNDLVLLSPLQQLRKTTLSLASRLPHANEIESITTASTESQARQRVFTIIDTLFTETAFFVRIKEIYNDVLLTNAYQQDAKGLSLALHDFVNKNYYNLNKLKAQGYNNTDAHRLRDYASDGITQAPLALIVHVIKNNRPFSEILTADYLMVNPYSAAIFSAKITEAPAFNFSYGDALDLHDHTQFMPAKIIDKDARPLPHAGVLSTLPFLSRYSSSKTNLNRKRARYVFQYFLDTDVEGLADRATLNLDNIVGEIPTLQDPQCKACHNIIDPVAGLFKNWRTNGRFAGDNTQWKHTTMPPEMLPPGLSAATEHALPETASATALPWLAHQISQDNRFVSATVKTLFKGFTGIDPIDDLPFMQQLKTLLIEQNLNVKALIKAIITSQYFLADQLTQISNLSINYSNYGTANLLTPEQLHRKIEAVFNGYEWLSPAKYRLISFDTYQLLYGGIDSWDIIVRTTQPTGVMAGIQARIANQLACQTVPFDFSLTPSERVLFPYVEIDHMPDNGQHTQHIKKNIQYLFERILGVNISINEAEIARSYDLFVSVIPLISPSGITPACHRGLASADPIIQDVNHTVRAWMAIVNLLVRDYRFLYE